MDFAESPYRYWANHINPDRPKKEPTPAMIMGSAFHTICLEFDKFADIYAIEPKKVLLKDVGRPLYEAYKAECEALEKTSKIVLTPADFDLLHQMKASLFCNEDAKHLIEGATYEQSYFWKDPESGLMVKARPDILHHDIIVDLKSCADASPRAFQRAMMDGGYHWQGAFIQDAVMACEGRFIENVINIAVEKTYPYSIGIYIIGEDALDAGRKQYRALLLDLKRSLSDNKWPDFEAQTIGLPAWAI